MPIAPRKVCRKAGCGVLTSSTYCGQHESSRKTELKQKDKERGTRTQRGYDNRWLRYSRRYREENPLCVLCEKEGILTKAECVDHIKPAINGQSDFLFWEPSNHRSLCWNCHSKVTAESAGGFGNIKKF